MQVVLLTLIPFTASAKEEWVKFAKFECSLEKDTFSINWIGMGKLEHQLNIKQDLPLEAIKSFFTPIFEKHLRKPYGEETVSYECALKDKAIKAEVTYSHFFLGASQGQHYTAIDLTSRVRIWSEAKTNILEQTKAEWLTTPYVDITRYWHEIGAYNYDGTFSTKNPDTKIDIIMPYRIKVSSNKYHSPQITICGEKYFISKETHGTLDCITLCNHYCGKEALTIYDVNSKLALGKGNEATNFIIKKQTLQEVAKCRLPKADNLYTTGTCSSL